MIKFDRKEFTESTDVKLKESVSSSDLCGIIETSNRLIFTRIKDRDMFRVYAKLNFKDSVFSGVSLLEDNKFKKIKNSVCKYTLEVGNIYDVDAVATYQPGMLVVRLKVDGYDAVHKYPLIGDCVGLFRAD